MNPGAASVISMPDLVRMLRAGQSSQQQSSYYRLGPPNMVDDPYFDPAFSGQNAIRSIMANTGRAPSGALADMTRAQQIRDTFIQTGPSLSNWY
jgi:hypothetical protein